MELCTTEGVILQTPPSGLTVPKEEADEKRAEWEKEQRAE
jgi:hypothetical protein